MENSKESSFIDNNIQYYLVSGFNFKDFDINDCCKICAFYKKSYNCSVSECNYDDCNIYVDEEKYNKVIRLNKLKLIFDENI